MPKSIPLPNNNTDKELTKLVEMRWDAPNIPYIPTIELPDPTPGMQYDRLFNTIWKVIKSWDINVPEAYQGYCGATGRHAATIAKAVVALMVEGYDLEDVDECILAELEYDYSQKVSQSTSMEEAEKFIHGWLDQHPYVQKHKCSVEYFDRGYETGLVVEIGGAMSEFSISFDEYAFNELGDIPF